MCLSRLGQILYGVAMFLALGLTLGGMLTPGWRQIEDHINSTLSTPDPRDPGGTVNQVKSTINAGLFSFLCTYPGEDNKSQANNQQSAEDYCKDWWKNQPLWEKIVIGLLCGAVIVEVIAFIYNLVTFCCCCCRGHALKPLAPLALICAILLGGAVGLYAFKNQDALRQNKSFDDLRDPSNSIGYSFFLECGALALLVINVVLGSITVCLGDKCL